MSRGTHSPRLPERLLDEAAAWVARRDAGLPAGAEAEFQAWLRSDPRCVEALQQCVGTWARLDAPRRRGAADGMVVALSSRQRRRAFNRRVALAGIAVVAAVFAVYQYNPAAPQLVAKDESTVVRRTPATSRDLPDGSVVEINQGAEIAVAYTDTARTIRLLQGEAHFDVVKDPSRPFIVEAGGVSVRAVGTAFAVRLDAAEVEVLVTEGVVSVDKPAGADTSAAELFARAGASQVPAGGRVLVRLNAAAEDQPVVGTVTAPELEQKLAWRTPRLEFSGTRLAEAVSQLNRHNRIKLVIEEASLAEMRISGNVRIDNPEGFVRMAEPLGLEAQRLGDEIRLRRAR
jgi:transmembrane sensor